MHGIVEYTSGTKEWYRYGKLHREDGPAIERADGTREWYQYGKWHRTDGPAIERADGTRAWWLNGKRHRTDGPAIECPDGTRMWYLNDLWYPFAAWLKENTTLDSRAQIMLSLKYGEQTKVA